MRFVTYYIIYILCARRENETRIKPVLHYALETEDCELKIKIQPIRTKRIKIKIIWLIGFSNL